LWGWWWRENVIGVSIATIIGVVFIFVPLALVVIGANLAQVCILAVGCDMAFIMLFGMKHLCPDPREHTP